jgi:uncharacterized sulfatase
MSISRRKFLLQAGGAAMAVSVARRISFAQVRTRKPNFIVVLCDDLGFGDIGAYGATNIKTPALDQMAREGVRLTNYYSPANLCTPSRAGFLTGRYAVRTGLAHEVLEPNDTRGLPPTEVTIAKALKPEYASAIIGKWHLGHVAPFWPPTNYGFDLFFGLPYSHDMKPLSLYTAAPGVELTKEDVDFPQLQQRFYQRAVRFIEQNRERPFFIDLSLSAPHLPEYPHPPWTGTSRAGAYGDVVQEIDAIVGQLLRRLRELKLERDTLVIFTSDNGPWFEGSSGPLRERKGGGAWDGGFRVPFIAWQPGVLPAGQSRNAIAMGIDLLPTFCALAQKPLPAGVELDGKNIGAVLATGATSPHDELLLFNNEDLFGIRTQRWKYVKFSYFRHRQESFDERGYQELFDLDIDPGENYSVASQHADVIADMERRMRDARRIFDPLKPLNPALGKRTGKPD